MARYRFSAISLMPNGDAGAMRLLPELVRGERNFRDEVGAGRGTRHELPAAYPARLNEALPV